MLLLLLFTFVGSVPIAAHVAGSWAYAASAREAQVQETALHEVRATLLQPAATYGDGEYGAEANARWKAPDGQVRTGEVYLPGNAAAGSTVTIWVNRSGKLVGSPLQPSQVTARANIARALAIIALALTLIIVALAGHWVLDRRRMAAWDADWLANGPSRPSRR